MTSSQGRQMYTVLVLILSLQNNQKVEYLDLSHNNFGEGAGMVLGPAISENSTMKELDLSWNSIRRKGAMTIAIGVKVLQDYIIRPLNHYLLVLN